MSGGALNYAYGKVEAIAGDVALYSKTNLHRAFATHLFAVAKALKDLEWTLSCDSSPGSEEKAIRAVVSRTDEVEQAKQTAMELIKELQQFVDTSEVKSENPT